MAHTFPFLVVVHILESSVRRVATLAAIRGRHFGVLLNLVVQFAVMYLVELKLLNHEEFFRSSTGRTVMGLYYMGMWNLRQHALVVTAVTPLAAAGVLMLHKSQPFDLWPRLQPHLARRSFIVTVNVASRP